MAIDVRPNQWIASWSEDGSDVTFPIASVSELTAAEADGDTGDIRKVMFALLEQIYSVYNGLASADVPAGMKVSKQTSGTATNQIRRTFVFQFRTASTDEDVASESDIL